MLVLAALVLAVLVVVPIGACSAGGTAKPPPTVDAPKACTQEAKICPDGTAVSRTGPDCAFAPCPREAGAPARPEKPAPTR